MPDPNIQKQEIIADQFQVVEPIKAGNFGQVYRVLDLSNGNSDTLILKLLKSNYINSTEVVNRFEQRVIGVGAAVGASAHPLALRVTSAT